VRFFDTNLNLEVATRQVSVEVKTGSSSGAGWTQFAPSPDTRKVYVSNSLGNDANNGLSEASPKKTLGAGMSLLRDNYPDWLLLKKGDTWTGSLGAMQKSGRSSSEPILITSYGSGARPKVMPAADSAAMTFVSSCRNIAVVDLHLVPQSIGGEAPGLGWYSGGQNFLVEGCLIEQFYNAIVLQGGGTHKIRRNVMVDTQRAGMYVAYVNGPLLEENVLDRLGNDPSLAFYFQGFYLDGDGNSGHLVRGNIISDTTAGMSMRAGGTAEDNLFVRCALALPLGGGPNPALYPNGVQAVARNNVILDGKDINAANPRGWGIILQNIASAQIENNIVANIGTAGYPFAFEVDGWQSGAKVHNTTFRDNISYGWKGEAMRIKGNAGSQLSNLLLDGNHFQNSVDASALLYTWDDSTLNEVQSLENTFFSQLLPSASWVTLSGVASSVAEYKSEVGDTTSGASKFSYPDPTRTLAKYSASQGYQSTHAAFMAEARKQSRDNWRPEFTAPVVNDWVRAGFGR
jgi:hypothetical protein